jgi:hypothetical protein
MKKTIITILLAVITLTISAQESLPSSVLTDTKWRNEMTGDWEIAFFENFAVYDCKFWDYESVNEKGGRFDITLRNNGNSLPIQIDKEGNLLPYKVDARDLDKLEELIKRMSHPTLSCSMAFLTLK